MNSHFLSLAMMAFTLATLHTNVSAACFSRCRFKFCTGATTFPLKDPNKPFTDEVCLPGSTIGAVATAEAFVQTGSGPQRVSRVAYAGLTQRFSASFLKSVSDGEKSCIAHEDLQGNQKNFLNGKCFAVPITSYQKVASGGGVLGNVVTAGRPLVDCVALITKVPK